MVCMGLGLRLLDKDGREVQKSIDGLYEVKSLDILVGIQD